MTGVVVVAGVWFGLFDGLDEPEPLLEQANNNKAAARAPTVTENGCT